MKKNITPAILLLIAFSVILVHDVIPHHHHQDHNCCEHSSCHPHHPQENDGQEGSSSNQDSCCVLAHKIILTPASIYGFGIYPKNTNYSGLSWKNAVFIAGELHSGIILHSPLPFRQTPFKENSPILFTAPINGMRAPPAA